MPTSRCCKHTRVRLFNQSKTRDAQASLGTLIDASAVTAAYRRLFSATRSNEDIDWPVLSLLDVVIP